MAELFEAVPQVIEAANADPSVARRFLANPLFLVEEMGYTLTDEMRHFAARRVRFASAKTFERLCQLEAQVWEQAGERFDLDSGEAVANILFTKLKLNPAGQLPPQSQKAARGRAQKRAAAPASVPAAPPPTIQELAAPLRARMLRHEPIADPLEALREAHPIMPPLLEYRQLEASCPRLAPRAAYDRIAKGEVELPFTKLSLRLKKIPQVQPEREAGHA